MMFFQHWIDNRWSSLATVMVMGALLRFTLLADIPNGYFHDEAWSVVKADELVSGTAPPQVYFAENNGMDALHVYLIALLFKFTGPLAIGSRLVSSFLGSLTVLATYWVARELFADSLSEHHRRASPASPQVAHGTQRAQPQPDPSRRHRFALIAASVVATLFWALSTSRSGWHIASVTLVTTLSLAALLRGRRTKRRSWFLAAGLLAGLAQYTYPTARFLPVLLVLIGLLDFAAHRAERRSTVTLYALLLASAAIIFAPLGAYFVRHPEWFFTRAQQTMDAPLSENILKTLAGFSLYGDAEGLHNLLGRPALDPVLSVFFVVGLIVCAVKRRTAHGVLIAWLIVFSLPVVVTGQAPLFRRWTGVLPAEGMLVALGALGVTDVTRNRLGPIAVGAALIVSATWSIADYFGPYATSPHMFWAYDTGVTQVADYIRTRPDATVFLTPYDRYYEVIRITLAEARRSPPIQSYNGVACALFPGVTLRESEWVVIVEKDERSLPLMQRVFPNGQVVWQIDSPLGAYARAYQVTAGQAAQIDLPDRREADLGGMLRLTGFDVPSRANRGHALNVTLALKSLTRLDRPYKVFVHLRGAGNAVLAQTDRLPCDFSLNEADWRPGDIVLETYAVEVPADTPPGEYRLVMGVYQPDSGARLAVLASDLPHEPDGVDLGIIEIRP